MKYFKYILLAVFAFILTACATGPKIDYDGISSKIQSGETGGVIGGFQAGDGLSYASLNVVNVEDNSKAYVSLSKSPRVYSLKPGTYKIKSGSVGGYNVKGNMPLISVWAENFEVKAGEVTNLGQLQMNTIKNNVQTGGGWKVINALSSFGTNLNSDVTHAAFSVSPMSGDLEAKAIEKFTGLEGRVVSQPLGMRFTETEFRGAVAKASEPDADGKLPTKNEIRSKLSSSLVSMMFKSILSEKREGDVLVTP